MQINIKKINATVEKNKIQEVKTSVMFQNSTIPHPDGLASYEIFGEPGTEQRQTKWGYIDLGTYFVHPIVYKILIGLKRELYKNLLRGEGTFAVINGEVVQIMSGKTVPANIKTGTGTQFLMDNWKNINFNPTPGGAMTTNLRKKTLSLLSKEDVFINKWLVMPAFYRDVDTQTNKRNEYNILYARLISLSKSVKMMSNMGNLGIVSEAEKNIQATLFELFTMYLTFVSGSHGFIHEHVMGKASVYSARLVISSGSFNHANPEMAETDVDHSGLPLVTCAKIFFPFIVYGLNEFFFNSLKTRTHIYTYPTKEFNKQPIRVQLHPAWTDMLSPTNLEKRIELYQDSPYHRLEPVRIRTIDDEEVTLFYLKNDSEVMNLFNYTPMSSNETVEKDKFIPLTWMHLLYMVAYQMCSDKHIYITRYPITTYNSIYPSLMNILPSSNYKPMKVNGKFYPRFPVFPEKSRDEMSQSELDGLFVDTLKIHTTNLAALGADHDGDMVNVNPVFSEEANADAQKYMDSVLNIVGISGGVIREEKDVLLHALYALTYRYNAEMFEKKVINY